MRFYIYLKFKLVYQYNYLKKKIKKFIINIFIL